MGNILNHNRSPFTFRLDKSEYWDFHLSQPSYGRYNGTGLRDECLVSYIDTTDPECIWFDRMYGKQGYAWDEAENKGLTLNNIGYTGVDNGYINFKKDRTSNEEFLRLFNQSELRYEEGDVRLQLGKVCGNNDIYDYSNDIVEEDGMVVAKLNGGFYQGFFRTEYDYKVLPMNVGNGLTFEFELKKSNLEGNGGLTLNERHPENKGIFFYLGTRAENKWWKHYRTDFDAEDAGNDFIIDGYVNNDYTDGYNVNTSYIKPYDDTYYYTHEELYAGDDYFSDCYLYDKNRPCCESHAMTPTYKSGKPMFTYPEFLNTYEDNSVWFTEDGHLWIENEHFTTRYRTRTKDGDNFCCGQDYFGDGYLNDDYYLDSGRDCTMYVKDGYISEEEEIDVNEELFTKDGYSVRQPNVREYRSDNKFLMFDRTCDGMTTDTWVEGTEAIITDIVTPKMENYFLLFDRTCNGYTTESIKELIHRESLRYDLMADLYRNAIAFQITDDGKIGYKYMVKDCEEENKYKIESEWSGEKAVKDDEWTTVAIRISPVGRIYGDDVEKTSANDRMRIDIYVDGKLKLSSTELPTLNLRKLNDVYSKQEGVPFNISIGGGTQGLCDVIYLDYRQTPKSVLPLEKEFAGSFVGYFKSFRMYDCRLSFSEIAQNVIFDGHFRKDKHIY